MWCWEFVNSSWWKIPGDAVQLLEQWPSRHIKVRSCPSFQIFCHRPECHPWNFGGTPWKWPRSSTNCHCPHQVNVFWVKRSKLNSFFVRCSRIIFVLGARVTRQLGPFNWDICPVTKVDKPREWPIQEDPWPWMIRGSGTIPDRVSSRTVLTGFLYVLQTRASLLWRV